jgi:tetratricopeptide (TPR) repeat protein
MSEPSTDQLLEAAIHSQFTGDNPKAESLLREILTLDPNDPDATQLLAVVLTQTSRPQEALPLAKRAVELTPDAPDAHATLADVHESLGQHDQSIPEYQTAIKIKPDFAEAHGKLGRALQAAGRLEESAAALRRAIDLQPNYPDALFSLANTLRSQNNFREAIDYYRRSLAIAPHNAHVHYNVATALEMDCRPEEALDAYRRAIDGKLEMAHAKYGMLLLSLGRWKEGWQELEWVDWYEKQLTGKPRFPHPIWDGARAPDKTLLLYEGWGGMGDVLQFARFIPRVTEMRIKVILQCPEPLVEFLAHSLKPAQVIAQDTPIPTFDLCLPLESLPHRLKITPETLSPSVPYLSAPPERLEKWKRKIPQDNQLNVGLVWAGSESSRRTSSFEIFAPLATVKGVRFVSLQKGPASKQPPPPGLQLLDFTNDFENFADTAAVIQQLDLVIGVDTSTPHLAAAMARPTWILIPRHADCRWMLDREDSPWYPTMRLFRQEDFDDWQSPMRKMTAALAKIVGTTT